VSHVSDITLTPTQDKVGQCDHGCGCSVRGLERHVHVGVATGKCEVEDIAMPWLCIYCVCGVDEWVCIVWLGV